MSIVTTTRFVQMNFIYFYRCFLKWNVSVSLWFPSSHTLLDMMKSLLRTALLNNKGNSKIYKMTKEQKKKNNNNNSSNQIKLDRKRNELPNPLKNMLNIFKTQNVELCQKLSI